MGQPQPLTETEREKIYEGKLQGKTQAEIAKVLDRSIYTVRKWWQRVQDEGGPGLASRKRGRKPRGILSTFDDKVIEKALELKQKHRRWGPDRVLVELGKMDEFSELILPHRSRLAQFYKEKCPECVGPWQRIIPTSAPLQASRVHEVWQLDHQEGHLLGDDNIATICNIRDPFGAAMLASRAFAVKTAKHWRKLTWEEVRQVLRLAFIEWRTLPERVQTDNELGLAGHPTDPFPSSLTLWLVGLGVSHRFIRPHTPTDQPQIERNHRTIDGFTFDEESRANLSAFQQALDRERQTYNHHFPSQASDCAGRPPLVTHPELLQPPRPYQLASEFVLFDIQRVYDYLTTFTFQRKVNTAGQVSLKHRLYSIGRSHAGKAVLVWFDPHHCQWVFYEDAELDPKPELARRNPKDLTFEALTGLNPKDLGVGEPLQLALPLPI